MKWLLASVLAMLAAEAGAASPGRTVLMSEEPEARRVQEEWGFAEAVIAGDTIYLSGLVVGLGPGETDLELAYDRVFRRIAKILDRAGAGWDDVVDITSFHTDLTSQMPAIIEVKKRYVKGPPSAWTAVEVSRLIPDRGITEIKIVARRPERK